jgi:HK97 family phage major capsid protein
MADISRSEVSTIIQEEYSRDFLDWAAKSSAVLSAFPTRNMGTKTINEPVLLTKPHAGWVGESATAPEGVKPTDQVTWGNKSLVAEELAVIIPIHENVLDDATEDLLAEIVKAGGEAIAYALDAAVIFGTNKPASWVSSALYASAVAGSQVFVLGGAEDGEDLSGQILNSAEALSERYEPTTLLSKRGLRFRLANQRATTGESVFQPVLNVAPGQSAGMIHGLDAYWVTGTCDDGEGGELQVWDPSDHGVAAIVADRSRVVVGVRQDITVKFLDQATVGSVNLAERDMVALRFKARFAYALGDNIAYGKTNNTSSPVAAVVEEIGT